MRPGRFLFYRHTLATPQADKAPLHPSADPLAIYGLTQYINPYMIVGEEFTMRSETMGERLKRLREAAGMSQPQLASAAGVPVGTFRQWEQGRRLPSLQGFIAVGVALGVSLDELAGLESPRTKQKRKKGR
jgi:DNA-binding XRE family transcriptional regulator